MREIVLPDGVLLDGVALPSREVSRPALRVKLPRSRWGVGAHTHLWAGKLCHCALGWLAISGGATPEDLSRYGLTATLKKVEKLPELNSNLVRLAALVNDQTAYGITRLLSRAFLPPDLTYEEVVQLKEKLLCRIFAHMGVLLLFEGSSEGSPQLRSLEAARMPWG